MKLDRLVPLVLIAALSCSDGGPQAGSLTFDLVTPRADDGAVQFKVTTVTPNTVTGVSAACTGCNIFSEAVSDTEIRGVVTGQLSAGALISVGVSDVKSSESFTAQVVAVASRDYALRPASNYSLEVVVQ